MTDVFLQSGLSDLTIYNSKMKLPMEQSHAELTNAAGKITITGILDDLV